VVDTFIIANDCVDVNTYSDYFHKFVVTAEHVPYNVLCRGDYMTAKETIIGTRIRQCRNKMGITQDQLAEIMRDRFNAETDRPTISKWETGFQQPTVHFMKLLADIFGVTLDYLNGKELGIITDNNSNNQEYNDDQKWALDASKDPKVSRQLRDIWKAVHGDEHNHF